MATKSDSIIPILVLAGLAAFLLYQRSQPASAAQTAAAGRAATDKINAVGSAIKGFVTALGGVTGNDGSWSSDKPSQAALDQVIDAAKAWDKAYGGITGADGDPYGDWS